MQFTIGHDVEVFLRDAHGFKSAIGYLFGDKQNPRPLFALGDGFAVLEDNVSCEFNIPPQHDAGGFIKACNDALNYIKQEIAEHGLTFAERVSATSFPVDELRNPAALEFGCDPDFNAWTKAPNPRPCATDSTLRSCGGHVHVGFDQTKLDYIDVVRAMDVFLGLPSVFLDADTKRRALYGKAGAHRPKPYGVEYRTLSNFWIWDEHLMQWVFDGVATVLNWLEAGNVVAEEDAEAIQAAINNSDKALALMLMDKYGVKM